MCYLVLTKLVLYLWVFYALNEIFPFFSLYKVKVRVLETLTPNPCHPALTTVENDERSYVYLTPIFTIKPSIF